MSTDWKVYTYEDISGGGTWTLDDSSLKRPNETVSEEVVSTHSIEVLLDGDIGFVEPEIKGRYSPVQFVYYYDDLTIYNQFKEYQQNGKYLKITTHNANITYYVKVANIVRDWLAGETDENGNDLFNVLIVFDFTVTLS